MYKKDVGKEEKDRPQDEGRAKAVLFPEADREEWNGRVDPAEGPAGAQQFGEVA